MKLEKENEITVVDAEGNEHLMEVLFTYENEARNAQYVFFFDPSEPETIIPMKYTDDGELIDIEDEEEYGEVEEVFNAFNEDPKIQEAKKN